MTFPKNFVWGAAAASYQIEGAAYEDGKGLSVWDMFCKRSDTVFSKHTADVACDHYHLYVEDVGLMKQIGLKAYRMSISWPRVIPAGTGAVNPKGLDFYDRLIDELLKSDITPYVTLFHWDYPWDLYCRGGWLNPDSSDWFADYTRVVVEQYSDRVKNWMTINEPQIFIILGHTTANHAPGDKYDLQRIMTCRHNVLLSHGKSVQTIRRYSKQASIVGMAPCIGPAVPNSDSAEDVQAAMKYIGDYRNGHWGSSWWLDPFLLGSYPLEGVKLFEKELPVIGPNDMKTICQPLDFLGINIYSGQYVKATPDGGFTNADHPTGMGQTANKWFVMPEALYWGPKFLFEKYKLPIIITENGLSNTDWVAVDGKVHDPQRIDFLTRYLRELHKAIAGGVDVRGYFQWSIMDNFEWSEGFKERFGLIHVNYTTLKRTLKDSAYWYGEVVRSNGEKILETRNT